MDTSPMFRFLRPGQRVTFDLVDDGGEPRPRNLRIGIV
jgi:cold shock CspA family protein